MHRPVVLSGALSRSVARSVAQRLVAIALLVAGGASAQQPGDLQRAREAYNRGTEAYHRGDYAAAAAAYRDADAAAPSAVALQAALDAAVKADDPALGAELLERAHARKVEVAALAASVKRAETKLGHRAGRVHLTCAKPCSATIDGAAFDVGTTPWKGLGDHAVVVSIDGRSASTHVMVSADQTAEVGAPAELLAPSPPPPPPTSGQPTTPPIGTSSGTTSTPMPTPLPRSSFVDAGNRDAPAPEEARGIGRGWFWAGLGTTAAGLVGSGLFFALMVSDHGSFAQQSCATVGSSKCTSLAQDGLAAEVVGDVFLGVGIAAAVWTVVSGVWLVRWSGSRSPAVGGGVRASALPGGGALTWSGTF